ncbi:alkene reductase [Patulibacter sp. NPDC049589]|uniref:alkene reductase n=1 Tax=Patulibacter sp. NPDC049589 TaxID=3154731 RepID=UPI00342C4535
MTDDFDVLRQPLTLGAIELPHRLVMAPLTRNRADEDGTANELIAEYYGQRAGSAALIVSEATWVSQQGKPYPRTPGIATDQHRDGWRLTTDAVHAEGGKIVAQLWHGGRIGHPDTSGQELVSASATPLESLTIFTPTEAKAAIPAPRALTLEEITTVVQDFVAAAKRAIDAGFDGVEVHAANGYLLQQFLSDNTNHRDDAYGGSPENRARFVAEVVRAVVDAIGADRVGIRLSPLAPAHEMAEQDGGDTYRALAKELAPLHLAYVHLLAQPEDALTAELRAAYGAPVLLNTGFAKNTERAEAISFVADGHADASVVGRAFIANPDLYERWSQDAPQNETRTNLFYASGPEGYTDYPTLAEAEAQTATA